MNKFTLKKNKKGQAMVEMALVMPIFLLIIIGIFDFGIALHCWSSLNHQCVQAARLACKRNNQLIARNLYLSTTHTSLADVQKAFWDARSPIMKVSDYDTIDWSSTGIENGQDSVTVSASYNLTLMTPFVAQIINNSNDSANGALKITASATEKKE